MENFIFYNTVGVVLKAAPPKIEKKLLSDLKEYAKCKNFIRKNYLKGSISGLLNFYKTNGFYLTHEAVKAGVEGFISETFKDEPSINSEAELVERSVNLKICETISNKVSEDFNIILEIKNSKVYVYIEDKLIYVYDKLSEFIFLAKNKIVEIYNGIKDAVIRFYNGNPVFA